MKKNDDSMESKMGYGMTCRLGCRVCKSLLFEPIKDANERILVCRVCGAENRLPVDGDDMAHMTCVSYNDTNGLFMQVREMAMDYGMIPLSMQSIRHSIDGRSISNIILLDIDDSMVLRNGNDDDKTALLRDIANTMSSTARGLHRWLVKEDKDEKAIIHGIDTLPLTDGSKARLAQDIMDIIEKVFGVDSDIATGDDE